MTDLQNTQWKYFFPCGQWLAKSEGDGAICRDLIGSRDPLATRKGVGASGLSGHFAIIYCDWQGLGKPKGKLAVFFFFFFFFFLLVTCVWFGFVLNCRDEVDYRWIFIGVCFVVVDDDELIHCFIQSFPQSCFLHCCLLTDMLFNFEEILLE